jgi:hypothetical protein
MMMAMLPLSMHRRPCHCQAGAIALVTMALLPLIRDGVVALIAMTLLPSSSWHCCPCYNGVNVIIDMQASLPSLQWLCCPVSAVVELALLPSLLVIKLVSLPSS